jgi:hypothetical protein
MMTRRCLVVLAEADGAGDFAMIAAPSAGRLEQPATRGRPPVMSRVLALGRNARDHVARLTCARIDRDDGVDGELVKRACRRGRP